MGCLILLAVLMGRLAARFGLPNVVGELCTGVLLGPSVLAHLAPGVADWLLPRDPAQQHLLDASGQIGVLLLVGLTGAGLDLGLIRRRAVSAVSVSVAGVVIPTGLGICAGLLVPDSLVPASADRSVFALFLGVAMGISAIPVIAKTLAELGLLRHEIGRLILCAVLVDDIVGWILLSVLSGLATHGARAQTAVVSVLWVATVVLVAAMARPFVRRWLRGGEGTPRADTGPACAVAVILLSAGATQAMGLEAVFGAFMGGMVVGGSTGLSSERLAAVRTTTMTVLAPLFFATAGLRIDLTALTEPVVLLTGLAVLCVAVAGKFAGAYVGARLGRLGHWEGLALGAGMNARGVIEVVIAMVGLRLGVLSSAVYTIVVLVAIATSLMAPPLLRATMRRVRVEQEVPGERVDPPVPCSSRNADAGRGGGPRTLNGH
ncbi:cation:proton antiporter [Streptomyces sp. NPDC001668]|uniref:cation:proton antiporter n=1 Tax=unclassified Streptomyces TaxID=2593676 RepID=UPI0033D6A7C8